MENLNVLIPHTLRNLSQHIPYVVSFFKIIKIRVQIITLCTPLIAETWLRKYTAPLKNSPFFSYRKKKNAHT